MRCAFILLVLVAVASAAKSFPAGASPIFHSDKNWRRDEKTNYLETANSGSYIKFTFTGTTQLTLVLDKNNLKVPAATIAWSIDSGAQSFVRLPVANQRVVLAQKLDPKKPHTLFFYVRNSIQNQDRWFSLDFNIRVLAFETDDTGVLSAPVLSPRRMMAYWDSIGEGVNTVDAQGGDIYSNDALLTWAFSLAGALDAELEIVAWGGQGFSVGGGGNIPPLWNADGKSNTSAWAWHNAIYPRSFSACPDLVLNGHGTNDGLHWTDPAVVAARALGWLKSMRATCPTTKIFQVVPYGNFERDGVTSGFQQYQKVKDPNAHLIDLGDKGAAGLTWFGASWCSFDGIHPLGWRSSQLGAMLAGRIIPKL